MKKKELIKLEAVNILKEWGIAPGIEVYGKVNHVSSSGMSRNIGLYAILDGRIVNISYHAARAMEWGYKDDYNGGVKVGGCGMDMIFHTIDTLSWAMGYGSLNQETGKVMDGLKYRHL